MNIADKLAQKRTELAYERTLLSFIRTGIMFLSAGVAIVQMKALTEIFYLGWILIGIAPIFIVIGIVQFKRSKKLIKEVMKHSK